MGTAVGARWLRDELSAHCSTGAGTGEGGGGPGVGLMGFHAVSQLNPRVPRASTSEPYLPPFTEPELCAAGFMVLLPLSLETVPKRGCDDVQPTGDESEC